MIKKLLIMIMGKLRYCREFHAGYPLPNRESSVLTRSQTFEASDNDESKWYCSKCNLSYKRTLSDYDTGPM